MAEASYRPNNALHLAVETGDKKTVRRILGKSRDVDALDEDGYTALHVACKRALPKIAKLLLKNGAYVDVVSRDDRRSALHFAAGNGMKETVALLLHRSADVHGVDVYGFTALHQAANSGQESMIRMLLKNGSNIEARTIIGRTPLAIAVSSGKTRAADSLICSGANVHCTDSSGLTLLHLAAEGRDASAMELLLDAKLDIDIVDGEGRTALQYVLFRYPILDTLKWLLKNGAGINYQCRTNGFTALHFAVQDGRRQFVELLFKYGADLNVEDNAARSPLGLAAALSHFEVYPEFAKQLSMMRALNLSISESNLTALSEDDELKKCCAPCYAEIEEMTKLRIADTNIKLYDVFSRGENRLARYAANEKVEHLLEFGSCLADFPIYANVIHKKFLQGRNRRDLLRRSTDSLFGVINKYYELPLDCVEVINRCLTNEDLALQIK